VLSAKGGTAPYTWSLASPGLLPSGLQLNSTTGVISGYVTGSGPYLLDVQVADKAQKTSGASLTLTITPQGGVNCGPPAYPCSRTDTQVLIPSSPPQLGANPAYYGGHLGAGWVAASPVYNDNRVLRVTDGNTNARYPGESFATGSSAEKNVSSYDESLFMVHSPTGLCLYQYDPEQFKATFRGCFGNVGESFDFGYTQADQLAFYSFSFQKLYRFLINTADWTISPDPTFNGGQGYFDPDNPSCLNGQIAANHWYIGDTALSSDDETVIAAVGPQQDEEPYYVVWNATKGCEWMNVRTWQVSQGWNTGMDDPVNIAFLSGHTPPMQQAGIHNAQLDRSGAFGVLTINNLPGLDRKVFWTIGTNKVDDTCASCRSHWACDFGTCFWSADKSLSELPIGGSIFTPDVATAVKQPEEDSHMSHANASDSARLPYLASYDPDASTVGGVWEDELVGVNWNGSQIVYRFNKTWSTGGYGGFNTTARCSISRQGSYALCTSDYQMYNLDKGFGNGLNQDTCDHNLPAGIMETNGCRTDVLLFELR
jgi:hypothetical protein